MAIACAWAVAAALSTLSSSPQANAASTGATPCDTLDACIQRVAAPRDCLRACGVSAEEQALAQRLWEIGAPAVPRLIALLNDADSGVRERVARILSGIDGLNEDYLIPLTVAWRYGNEWAPLAIAHIGTRRAIELLLADLRHEPGDYSYVTDGLVSLRGAAVPYLLEAFNCHMYCADMDRYLDAIGFLLREIGDESAPAMAPLAAIAADAEGSPWARRGALHALGDIGPRATPIAPQLRTLLTPESGYARQTANALGRIRDSAAVDTLVAAAHANAGLKRAWMVRAIAELGPFGASAAPFVRGLLNDPDWDVRVEAARTLGWLGFHDAIPDLIQATRARDWHLVYQAALSLAALGATDATARLQEIADSHWHPDVRAAAAKSLERLASGHVGASKSDWDGLGSLPRPAEQFLIPEHAACEHREVLWQCDWVAMPRRHDSRVEVDVAEGRLIAADFGDFGGRLSFRDWEGRESRLLAERIVGLYEIPDGIVAVTGWSSDGADRGMIYRLQPAAAGRWEASPLQRLPGFPYGVVKMAGGGLLLSNGAWVAALQQGDLQWLACR
jgi:HEAT repeat protein